MNKVIVANWKMNPRTEREALTLARASDMKDVVICPPFPFISRIAKVLRRASLGAQNVFPGTVGAQTGEVSAGELKALGAQFCIVGHSERRAEGERDTQVARKIVGAYEAGLIPILCVGEPWSVRKKGSAAARAYVKKQLHATLSHDMRYAIRGTRLLVAYEPVWAISTAKNHTDETPEDAARMAKFIRSLVKSHTSSVGILYGGSVNAQNVASFLTRPEFAGVLVGGASIRPAEFKAIVRLASQ